MQDSSAVLIKGGGGYNTSSITFSNDGTIQFLGKSGFLGCEMNLHVDELEIKCDGDWKAHFRYKILFATDDEMLLKVILMEY